MKDSSSLAIRSEVPMGNISIEGYLLPEKFWTKTNKFGVSKTQAVMLAYPDYERSQASKRYLQIAKSNQAKTVALKGFTVHPKIGVLGANEKVDLLPVDQLIPFLKVCKKLGSAAADELIDDLAGLSLQQLFSDAFGQKFEQEERQEYLKWRQITRTDFHPVLTDSIQRNINPKHNEWGKYIKQFQDSQGIKSGTRDSLPPEKLARLAMAQHTAAALLDAGMDWSVVLEKIAG